MPSDAAHTRVVAVSHPLPLLQTGLAARTKWTPVADYSQLGGEVGTQAQGNELGGVCTICKEKDQQLQRNTHQSSSLLYHIYIYTYIYDTCTHIVSD